MQEEMLALFHSLRERIIAAFEAMDGSQFQRKSWEYTAGHGGGEIALLKGSVFEKAAVNYSKVSGDQFPMQDGSGPFFAAGVSLITHMHNPHAPTVHMNVRYIETKDRAWIGGGYDLTPMGFAYEEDTLHFHRSAKTALGEPLYRQFSQNAKEYFYIPHRKKERGVGGIFFDHLAPDPTLLQKVGVSFLQAIMPIYERRTITPYTDQEKQEQNRLRAHYVEFNLLYDRGTKFGFASHGNPEAILCSMPPSASW